MENYIVRIYRRDTTDPDKLAGVFESVEHETTDTFTSLNRLIDLLAPERDTGGDANQQKTIPASLPD